MTLFTWLGHKPVGTGWPGSTRPMSTDRNRAGRFLWPNEGTMDAVPTPSSVPGGRLGSLPRAWWFPPLRGYRGEGRATYLRFDLDAQPVIEGLGDDLAWLEREPEKLEWSIEHTEGGPPVRPLDLPQLEALAADTRLPPSLVRFAKHRDLQRRVRSATGCYLDLGDFAARTSAGDSVLVHFLSDQQWCRHWFIHVDARDGDTVLTSTAPIGFDLPSDWADDPGEVAVPDVIPLDGSFDLEVCADSFIEFLYRYWVESELYYALAEGQPAGPVAAYAAELRKQP